MEHLSIFIESYGEYWIYYCWDSYSSSWNLCDRIASFRGGWITLALFHVRRSLLPDFGVDFDYYYWYYVYFSYFMNLLSIRLLNLLKFFETNLWLLIVILSVVIFYLCLIALTWQSSLLKVRRAPGLNW